MRCTVSWIRALQASMIPRQVSMMSWQVSDSRGVKVEIVAALIWSSDSQISSAFWIESRRTVMVAIRAVVIDGGTLAMVVDGGMLMMVDDGETLMV